MATTFVRTFSSQTPTKPVSAPSSIQIRNYVYTLSDFLGSGNFSKVYAGTNTTTHERVAIKIIELDSLKTDKLQQLHRSQLTVLSKMSHPNIIKCLQIFTYESKCYIITELCGGGDLDMLLKKEGVMNEDRAQGFIKDVFQGLSYMAERNIVHRDLKVANVFLTEEGVAKIADFGFAVFAQQKFSDLNIGSPFYMAPQSFIHCTYSSKTDIWAFGIFIYELFHGNSPYAFCKMENDLRYHLSLPFNKAQVRARMSPELKDVMYRCLQVNAEKRITIQQLRETPFFKKVYEQLKSPMFRRLQSKKMTELPDESPVRFKSYHQTATTFESAPLITLGGSEKKKPALVKTPSKHVTNQNQNQPEKTNMFQTPDRPIERRYNPRIIETNKKPQLTHLQVPKAEPGSTRQMSIGRSYKEPSSPIRTQRQRQKSIDSRKQVQRCIFLNSSISFKIAVNILHYCRGLFRCLLVMINLKSKEADIKYLTGWLILVLEELNNRLNEGGITFEGGNSEAKAKMFREVRNQYERKYTIELKKYVSNFINKPTLQDIKLFLFMQYRSIDVSIQSAANQQLLEVGHLVVLLYDATRVLRKCQQEHGFSRFQNYKDIESMLTWEKEKFDQDSYVSHKKRMIINN